MAAACPVANANAWLSLEHCCAKPLLLILDEATNALDRENEQMIRETLLALKGKVTVLLISHQASLMYLADEVVDLMPGKI